MQQIKHQLSIGHKNCPQMWQKFAFPNNPKGQLFILWGPINTPDLFTAPLNFFWLVLSDEQMSKKLPISLLNDEQMSNWVGVKHLPVFVGELLYLRCTIWGLAVSKTISPQPVFGVFWTSTVQTHRRPWERAWKTAMKRAKRENILIAPLGWQWIDGDDPLKVIFYPSSLSHGWVRHSWQPTEQMALQNCLCQTQWTSSSGY